MMLIYPFSFFGFSISVLLVGFLTLMKRRDQAAILFFIFCVEASGWSLGAALWSSELFPENVVIWVSRISHMFSSLIPITWLHFVRLFIGKKEPFKYFYGFFYALSIFFSLSCWTPYFIAGMHPILNFKFYASPGPVYHVFTVVFCILVPYAFYCLINAYRVSSKDLKKQYRYFLIAMTIAFTAGASTFFLIYKIPVPLYLIPTTLAFPFLMGIALTRDGLFDAQQIADAFQREKITALGIMAASLNHEMRNPLYIAKGRIEGYHHALENAKTQNEKDKKSEEIIDSVSRQLDRTLDIMQRFSDFARPQSLSKKEKVSISEFFKEVSDLVSHEIQRKNIQIKTEFQEGISVRIHRRQFEEIMVNLMINASQALGDKGGEIGLKAYQPNGKLHIEVSDNGPGITEENQKKIFDPFFSTKTEKGMGLGLYITKQLVEKNGGKIAVKSKPGKGTLFTLEFPQNTP